MKEALEKLEAEPDEAKTESREPVSMASTFFEHIGNAKGMLLKAAISGSLVASQAIYRALRKTIANRQSDTPPPAVTSSNPLD